LLRQSPTQTKKQHDYAERASNPRAPHLDNLDFLPGDQVWVKAHPTSIKDQVSAGLLPRWDGPHYVQDVQSPEIYLVNGALIHISNMKPYI